jgi:2-(1,2-epoxy-1,2-dihydrophenyl)acetyl-CoA isomerase
MSLTTDTTDTAAVDDGTLIASTENGVCRLTLNRPQARNALTAAMADGLLYALRSAADDPRVRAVVLTGAGGAFCAGGDVKTMAKPFDESGTGLRAAADALLHRTQAAQLLHEMNKPTIALMRGPAAGAGLSLALACDLRLAADDAKLTTAFARVGLSGDYGVSYFLPRLVGQARALALLMTSPTVGAAEAQTIGLVHQVFPAASFDAEADAFVRRLAEGPTRAYAAIKDNLRRSARASLTDALSAEVCNQWRCRTSADHRAAARAFVDKVPPSFSGH